MRQRTPAPAKRSDATNGRRDAIAVAEHAMRSLAAPAPRVPPVAGLAALALTTLSSPAMGQTTWRGLTVAPEHRCTPYRADDYAYPQWVEQRIVDSLGGIFSPYTGQCFGTTWETDIEHMIARSEAHDSGLCRASTEIRRQFASDPLNLTLADPALNRERKGAKDAAEWLPALNRCWFADRVIKVRQRYRLTIDRQEAQMLDRVLSQCTSAALTRPPCSVATPLSDLPPPDFSGPFDVLAAIWRAVRPYLGW